MFVIATITDKSKAPQIRRQLRAAGFSYVRPLREWVAMTQGVNAALELYETGRGIDGTFCKMRSWHEHHLAIKACIDARKSTRAA